MNKPIPLLPLVDENASLPPVDALEDFLASPVSCRLQVAPGSDLSVAKMFAPGASLCDGEVAPPAWWDEDIPALQPVSLIRIVGAYFFPEYGVLACEDGGALSMTAQQAQYGAPDLIGLPGAYAEKGGTWFRPAGSLPMIEKAGIAMAWGGLHNYGHFLLDCLPGVVTIGRAAQEYPLVFPKLKDWHRRHLSLLGVAPLEAEGVVWVRDAIYTNCMASFLHKPNSVYRDVAHRELEGLGREMSSGSRRIYLARDGNPKRIFKSEQSLQRRLVEMGFEILQPEAETVERQIKLFSEARVVVGNTGAAFANVLYCAPETLVVEVQPRGMLNLWVRKLCALGNCHHAAYFCHSVTLLEGHPESGLEFDFDVEKFVGFLASMGV